jgi:YD repeat-containing protein
MRFPSRLMRPALATLALTVTGHALAQATPADDALFECTPAAEESVAYYSDLAFRESPFEDIAGTGRMSAADATRRNHYRIARDARDRVVSVRHALGNRLRDPDPEHRFFSQAAEMRLCYPQGHEVRKFFNTRGRPTTIRGSVAEERFDLDEEGYRQALRHLGVNGQPVDSGWGIARYDWQRNDDGSVIETRHNLAGEAVAMRPNLPFERVRLRFGPSGWLAKLEHLDDKGALLDNPMNAAEDRLEYRASGEFIAWNVYDAKGERVEGNAPNVARGITSYHANGLPLSTRFEDRNGRPMAMANGVWVEHAEFDEAGNMTEARFFGSDGKLAVAPEVGCALFEFRWEAEGLLRGHLACFDAQRRPARFTQGGFHRVTDRFNASGDLQETRFEDENGRLIASTQGIARIVVRYDDQGRPIEREFLDAEGKPTVLPAAGSAVVRYRYTESGFQVRDTAPP